MKPRDGKSHGCTLLPRGYDNFLEAIRDPHHEEHEEMLEWIEGEFDSEDFDLDEINEMLKAD